MAVPFFPLMSTILYAAQSGGSGLGEKGYPYLYLDATYLKIRWGRA